MTSKKQIDYLKNKFQTDNPFEIASALGVQIIFEELGTINGYYTNMLRMKQIHINCDLTNHMKKLTCAHELGHAILHPDANTPFLRNNTFLSIDKLEIEANAFAMNLLISDELLLENIFMTTEQMSNAFGYNIHLIELRLESYFNMV